MAYQMFFIHRVWVQPNSTDLSVSTETKLKEYPVNEKEVHKILTQVNVTRRECEIVCMFFSLYSVNL